MEKNNYVGRRIEKLREKKGFSIKTLVRLTNLSTASVHRALTCAYFSPELDIKAFAEILDVEYDWLTRPATNEELAEETNQVQMVGNLTPSDYDIGPMIQSRKPEFILAGEDVYNATISSPAEVKAGALVTFCKLLPQMREQYNISVKELADLFKIASGTLWAFDIGNHIGHKIMPALCDTLNIPLEVLEAARAEVKNEPNVWHPGETEAARIVKEYQAKHKKKMVALARKLGWTKYKFITAYRGVKELSQDDIDHLRKVLGNSAEKGSKGQATVLKYVKEAYRRGHQKQDLGPLLGMNRACGWHWTSSRKVSGSTEALMKAKLKEWAREGEGVGDRIDVPKFAREDWLGAGAIAFLLAVIIYASQHIGK